MAFLLIWAKSSEKRLDDIYNYYCEKAGSKIARKIVTGVIIETQKLVRNPFMGQKEILLEDRSEIYRYLLCGNYKVIYYVEEQKNLIHVMDIFDTRQNPQKLHQAEQ